MLKDERLHEIEGWLRRHFLVYWKTWILILTPLVLLPLLLIPTMEARTGFVILLMSVYWISSALPLAVTSLLPIAFFPLMGVMGTNEVCAEYFKGSNVVFFCGVALALGVEQCRLHRRVALKALLLVGTDPKWLMLTFMIIATMLSMWITNSAVTAMLLPIVRSMLDEIFIADKDWETSATVNLESGNKQESADVNSVVSSSESLPGLTLHESKQALACNSQTNEKDAQHKHHHHHHTFSEYKAKVHIAMNISIAYSSSIGGAATLIGSGSPLLLKGIMDGLYPEGHSLTFPSYMAIAVPIALVNMFLTWVWLCILLVGFRQSSEDACHMKDPVEVERSLKVQYNELGPMNFHQIALTMCFVTLILLWFFKDPQFIPGWASLFPDTVEIGDATAGIVVIVLAFMIPAQPKFWCLRSGPEDDKPSPGLLDWHYTQKNFQWNVLLLLGGGYALSEATQVSHLADWLGYQLAGLSALPPIVNMALACFLTSAVTEVSSNSATAAIFLPVLAKLAEATGGNPLYLMIPATINCCYAFMLPVGTPCNAIVQSAAKIKTSAMMMAGSVMNVFTLITTCLLTATLGDAIFHWDVVPEWMGNSTMMTVMMSPSSVIFE